MKICEKRDEFARELEALREPIGEENFRSAVMSALILGMDKSILCKKLGCQQSDVENWAAGKIVPPGLYRARVIDYLREWVSCAAST